MQIAKLSLKTKTLKRRGGGAPGRRESRVSIAGTNLICSQRPELQDCL